MATKIKIVIADDHLLIAESWAAIINMEEKFQVIKVYDNTKSLIDELGMLKPDIIILDVNIGPFSGTDATKEIGKIDPAIKIIGVSMHNQPSYAKRMMQNGAMGYVTKNSSKDEMYLAINEVINGKKYICQEIQLNITKQLIVNNDESKNINRLTQREIEIVKLVKNGLKNKEIAATLFISQRTVETHRARILKKLGLKNSISLIKLINDSFLEL
jgi:DNA-binding NarL/FixJ family response regulator